jgi:hypothetical protein
MPVSLVPLRITVCNAAGICVPVTGVTVMLDGLRADIADTDVDDVLSAIEAAAEELAAEED